MTCFVKMGAVFRKEAGIAHSRWMQYEAPDDPIIQSVQSAVPIVDAVPFTLQPSYVQNEIQRGKVTAPGPSSLNERIIAPSLKSIIIGPALPRDHNDPLVTVVPSLLKQLDENALLKIGWDYPDDEDDEMGEKNSTPVPAEETAADRDAEGFKDDSHEALEDVDLVHDLEQEDDEDAEILDSPPSIFSSRKKKKAVKLQEQLDERFLRRSRRLSNKTQGYKDASSTSKAQPSDEIMDEADDVLTPTPLAVIPPSIVAPAPYLPVEVLEGIATRFLQIQPESVSAALLKKDDLDD